jgi:hypothetical protein
MKQRLRALWHKLPDHLARSDKKDGSRLSRAYRPEATRTLNSPGRGAVRSGGGVAVGSIAGEANESLRSVEELLDAARGELVRLSPQEAHEAARQGACLIDIRPYEQRAADGRVPGAKVISRNVLEWRLDPASAHRDPDVARRTCG